jgi:hypothetical protein
MKYTGSCHCGSIQYEADADLTNVMTCNCSHCAMKGFILTFVPASHFSLITGEDILTQYNFNKKAIDHLFCSVCGVEAFARGKDKEGNETVMINVRTLREVDTAALTPVQVDGRSW